MPTTKRKKEDLLRAGIAFGQAKLSFTIGELINLS